MNLFRCNLTIELGFGLPGSILQVSAGFKTIWLTCIGSAGSIIYIYICIYLCIYIYIFVVDLGGFYTISTIWQIGVDSDRFVNI